MKKNKISTILAGVLLIAGFTACNNNIADFVNENIIQNNETNSDSSDTTDINSDIETGSMGVNLFVPDYALAQNNGARVIFPDTTYVRLSYKKGASYSYQEVKTIALSTAEKTEVENAPNGFPGSVYKMRFSRVPTGTYNAGWLKVELLNDSVSRTVLSSGTNSETVEINMLETQTVTFYTLPQNCAAESGSIEAGKMVVLGKNFLPGWTYSMDISVGAGDEYPLLAIFDNKGALKSLKTLSAADHSINFEQETEQNTRYYGLYSNTAISSYNVTYSHTGDLEGALSAAEFNAAGFGSGSTFGEGWTKTGTKISLNNDVVKFDYAGNASGTLSKIIALNEAGVIKFKVNSNLFRQAVSSYSKSDGYLKLSIDNNDVMVYNDTNGDYITYSYLIDEGYHTVSWTITDLDTATLNENACVELKDIELCTPESEKNASISDGYLNYEWTAKTDSATDWHTKSAGITPVIMKNTTEINSNDEYVVFYNCRLSNGTSALTKTVTLDSAKTLSFRYKSSVYQQYDGYLQVQIDGDTTGTKYGDNDKTWKEVSIPLTAGAHTVSLAHVDSSSSSTTSGYDFYIYLDSIKIE